MQQFLKTSGGLILKQLFRNGSLLKPNITCDVRVGSTKGDMFNSCSQHDNCKSYTIVETTTVNYQLSTILQLARMRHTHVILCAYFTK